MPCGVAITRDELSAADLRREAFHSGDGRVACRLLAIAAVMEGKSRTDSALSCGMERQTLRDWIHRYNADGVEGLSDAARSGRPSALSEDQLKVLKEVVIAGPDVERDGVVRWRCVDLRSQIKERFDVDVHERTVGKLLHRIGLSHVQPRPYHPEKDAESQEAFKKTSQSASPLFCLLKRRTRRWKSGSRMKRVSVSKELCPLCGHHVVRVPPV